MSAPHPSGVPSDARVQPVDKSASAPASEKEGLVEWILRRRALKQARTRFLKASTRQGELFRRARLALEVGDRALRPLDPLRSGSGAPLAIEAYRESLFWSLSMFASAAKPGQLEGKGARVEELWEEAEQDLRAVAAPDSVAAARELLVARTFRDDAEEPEAVQAAQAKVLQELATALVARAHGPVETIDRLERQRTLRVLMSLLVVAVLGLGVTLGVQRMLRLPNLAAGKPWRASSTWAECDVEAGKCGGVTTKVFFHTQEDATPWVEIDLGAPTRFASVTVKNRSDCCDDRAAPIAVEVSNDQRQWTEVARKKSVFSTWNPSFPPQTARYVRLRVLKKTWLHLEQVMVHPPR
jgi:hypothetical protein